MSTSIEWTDETWNPTRGCSRVSAGCDHCYAMREARRKDHPGGAYEGLTRIGKRGVDWSGVVRLVPEKLGVPLRWRKPRRVFTNSMSDLFHESLPFDDIESVFRIMVLAERHTFQVLTKRPERMFDFCFNRSRKRNDTVPRNVWLGVSLEDQATADERIPLLLHTPAAVRFVSYEPALGPVDFEAFLSAYDRNGEPSGPRCNQDGTAALSWVIVGAESGPGARPFNPDWARSARDQCQEAGSAFFYKQDAIRGRKVSTPELDGRRWVEFPKEKV